VHFGRSLPPVLFDLTDDPDETRNVAGDAAYRSARLDMAERLLGLAPNISTSRWR
jgi:hypothetical protein